MTTAVIPAPRSSTKSPETFESLRIRNSAANTLQSYEKLSWLSFQRCESLTQTRLHCQRVVAGFSPDGDDECVLWREDFTPHPRKAGDDARARRKGKERASLGSNGSGDGKATNDRKRSKATDKQPDEASGKQDEQPEAD